MHLHRFSFNRGNIKGLKAVDERHRNYRAFGTERAFEGAAFEIQDLISVPASRSFCKNQVVSPFLHLLCHLADDCDRASYILSVDGLTA